MSYGYYEGTNKLLNIWDSGEPTFQADDIELTINFSYDAIGRLTSESSSGIERYYSYDVYGKLTGVLLRSESYHCPYPLNRARSNDVFFLWHM